MVLHILFLFFFNIYKMKEYNEEVFLEDCSLVSSLRTGNNVTSLMKWTMVICCLWDSCFSFIFNPIHSSTSKTSYSLFSFTVSSLSHHPPEHALLHLVIGVILQDLISEIVGVVLKPSVLFPLPYGPLCLNKFSICLSCAKASGEIIPSLIRYLRVHMWKTIQYPWKNQGIWTQWSS